MHVCRLCLGGSAKKNKKMKDQPAVSPTSSSGMAIGGLPPDGGMEGGGGLGEEFEEMLLRSARNGDENMVREMMLAHVEGKVDLNISCKGKSKSNLGWTPLHLASYFGHLGVAEMLLKNGANVNSVNDAGDTPLHKASFTGREDLVLLLLQNRADVNVINGEGQRPRDVSLSSDVRKLLIAAEQTELRKKDDNLLAATRDGHLEVVSDMLRSTNPPNINCVDALGNSCLHVAAYRGHKEVAVLLLQNGIDTSLRNHRGQTALELARDPQMQQVLDVQPLRRLHKTATRFEGQLLKRSRFIGWKPVWAVLERGVLAYFNNRADACSGVHRKDFKYLDGARVVLLETSASTFVIHFSDSTVHRLSVPTVEASEFSRQKWIHALQEHISFSTHYLNQGSVIYDSDEDDRDVKPLGSMQDALKNAAAHHGLLQKQLTEASGIMDALTTNAHAEGIYGGMLRRIQGMSDTAQSMLGTLGHCLTLFQQQEEVRSLQLKQEQEKCRVLEEALHVLAKEHHELEQSVASHLSSPVGSPAVRATAGCTPRFYDTSDDEFYDAFDADTDDGTLVTAASNFSDSDSDTLVSVHSLAASESSTGTLTSPSHSVAVGAFADRQLHKRRPRRNVWKHHHGRTRLPVPMFSRNDFSLWSVLKQCIGKELSKITMPVIFNEPVSFLQRMTEYMEYAFLLKKAAQQSDPIERIQYVTAFAVSALASNWERLGKPFNPLLGETYELEREDFRIVCEQVSHHPPVSAFHADNEDFIFHGSIHPKLKFWGKSVEIQPKGSVTVELPAWGEAYTWTNVNCCVHNIIVGKLWIEQYGTLELVNHSTGHRSVLTFKPAGWFSKDLHRVEGFITDKNKKKLFFVYGKWTEFIRCTDFNSFEEYMKSNPNKFRNSSDSESRSKGPSPMASPANTPKKVLAKLNSLTVSPFRHSTDTESNGLDDGPPGSDVPDGEVPKAGSAYSIDIPNSMTLWEAEPRPENTAEFYNFTVFAMSLNEMEPGMEKKLCPTDCRLRPDIRKLEEGDIDGAAHEKTRLEEKQREARKARKSKKEKDWTPRWFCFGSNPHTKQDDWLYTGGYWDRNFIDIPDIF